MASITRFYALILSTVLLLSGIPGFFPSVPSFQALVAFFALTLVHSVVHVAMGLLGLLITALASDESVRIYTIGIALLYGILAAVGIAGVNFGSMLYFNSADNWLHSAILVLSLGVFVAGMADERLHQRKARIVADLPSGHWALPSGPVQGARITGSPAQPLMPPHSATAATSEIPWSNQPAHARQVQPQSQPQSPVVLQQQWEQPLAPNPWGAGQQPASQPSQLGQPRDPWTREQRRSPSIPQPMQNPATPGNPWSLYPPEQDKWPPSQPSRSPSPQSAPSQNPWSLDVQPSQRPWEDAQPGDQLPLDGWPSLHDPRPLQ
ncbi:MAG: DUF4383 domain-containing protein [Nitrososphaerota archaeon]